jgi:hypothetical protein
MFRNGLVLATLVIAGAAVLTGCPGKPSQAVSETGLMPIARTGNPASSTDLPLRDETAHRPNRRSANWSVAEYNNPEYGLSFRYPRDYALEEAEVEERSLFLRRQDELEPDTKLLATILIPEDGFPNTTFQHGSLQVLVLEGLGQDGCKNLVDPESGALGARRVRLINAESATFWWSEEKSSADDGQIVEREYTTFLSGRCYEFYAAVAVGESTDQEGAEKQADPQKILRQLEKILLSVRISATPPPENISRAASGPPF